MDPLIKQAAEMLLKTHRAVALTGAGISIESGIPPFRGPGGLWEKIDPMEVAHIDAFRCNPRKVWDLLLKGMQQAGKVAITRFIMRGKEYIASVDFNQHGLMLHILFHQGEFKHIEEVFTLPELELKEKEMDLAVQIIENLSENFSEEMLADEYRERLLTIIRQRIEGQEVVLSEAKQPAKVVDLMEALKKSLEVTAKKKPAARVEDQAPEEKERERKRA